MPAYLSLSEITKSYGIHAVLNGITFTLNDGERIGLVGANGVGKSTLLKIIAGEMEADGGAIQLTPGMAIGYLPQVMEGSDEQTVADLIDGAAAEVRTMEDRMRALEAVMAESGGDGLADALAEYGEVSDRFERRGGYALESRIGAVLDGLGVSAIGRERRFGSLSGGERSRLGLALLLLQSPDVLLLDEPTNHLDFSALSWLEGFLSAYRGAMLIVSHDRQFLNQTVNAIVEIDEHSRQAKRTSGDYDTYLRVRTAERHKWEADFTAQLEEIKALRLAVKVTARQNSNYRAHTDRDKFVYHFEKAQHDSTVAQRVRMAEEKLRRIEADPIPRPPAPLRFNADFDPAALKGRLPLVVSGLRKAYGGRQVLDGLDFTIGLHSRIVLAGPNGAGKSTLIRLLAGAEAPDEGSVRVNPAARIGYLDQGGGDFDGGLTLFEAFKDGLEGTDQQIKAALIRTGLFRYEDFEAPVGGLSSGQRRKLQLARLIARRANLLLLDEPTNDVSFDVLEALEAALQDFPGPVIAASHDRRFMQQFGGEIWALNDGRLRRYLDGYEAYVAGAGTLMEKAIGE